MFRSSRFEGFRAGEDKGFFFRTLFFGATAAALHYSTLSQVRSTVAVRWLKIPRVGYFNDFGMITAESRIQDALIAFTVLNQMLGRNLGEAKSEWGIRVDFLGVTVAFATVRNKCEAQLSSSRDRIQEVSEEIETILEKKEAFRPICRN